MNRVHDTIGKVMNRLLGKVDSLDAFLGERGLRLFCRKL